MPHAPFQIDGNFGCTSGITEMLMQSHDGFIHLLPALPAVWSTGSIKGLRTRGGFDIIEMNWRDGKLTKLVIKSRLGGNCRIRTVQPLSAQAVTLKPATGENPNKLFAVPAVDKPIISAKAPAGKSTMPKSVLYDFNTVAGKTYVLTAQ